MLQTDNFVLEIKYRVKQLFVFASDFDDVDWFAFDVQEIQKGPEMSAVKPVLTALHRTAWLGLGKGAQALLGVLVRLQGAVLSRLGIQTWLEPVWLLRSMHLILL